MQDNCCPKCGSRDVVPRTVNDRAEGGGPGWPDLRAGAAVAGLELQGLQTLLARSGGRSCEGSGLPKGSRDAPHRACTAA